ncbi:2-hydroxyacid dehydrogenase [Actinoplanes sp. TFC3]|uniref:2-hydroxyacid dehydrogenase n=1 Tax=Actinoplanes sp. TFC3 TaxID=1710355 RepID=UPI00082AA128|nr:2-hydroxyacid dehydrogenase [Actinoplanes sp. TFC3]
MKVWIAHEKALGLLGQLPAGVDVEVCEDAVSWPSDPATVQFWVPPFASVTRAVDQLPAFTGLEVVQLLSAGADAWAGHTRSDVQLCDARGVHDKPVAEWVIGAAIAAFRQFPAWVRAQRAEQWGVPGSTPTQELTGKKVLIVGAGSIGRAVEQHLAPFDVTITRVARTARPRDGVHGVEELAGLLPYAQVVILLVPLTEQTRGLVDAAFLAALPDGALLINAARGPVAGTDALVAELASGRISAALDVTDPEPLPPGHPLWQLPNVLITPHIGGSVHGLGPRAYGLAGDQIRRHAAGEPLINLVTEGY